MVQSKRYMSAVGGRAACRIVPRLRLPSQARAPPRRGAANAMHHLSQGQAPSVQCRALAEAISGAVE